MRAGTHCGYDDSHPTGGVTSSFALQGENRRFGPTPPLRSNGILGIPYVGGNLRWWMTSEWRSNSASSSRCSHRFRCLQYRLRGAMRTSQNKRSMVSGGGSPTYKLKVDPGCIPVIAGKHQSGMHVRLRVDNMTNVCYINRMGAHTLHK